MLKLKQKTMKMKKGFTLLEILVVIGIIGILASMGISSYSTAQKKSRDAKRKADLKAFQNAIEQCYSINNYAYPTITLSNGNMTITEDCPIATGPDISITDPTTLTYTVSSTSTTYDVSITLEDGTTFSITQLQ